MKQQSHHQQEETKSSERSPISQDKNNSNVSMDDNTPPKLTFKQRRFVEVTAKTLNATEAAAQVYNVKGNRNSAKVIGSKNLTNANIKKAVEYALASKKQVKDVMQEALHADRPQQISWGELHKYLRTELELEGKLNNNNNKGNTVNVGLFIDNT